jgi:hypothetical protein
MTRFYVYQAGKKFIKFSETTLRPKLVNLEDASYWNDKRKCRTWESTAKHKYPDVKMVEAELKLKTK